MDADFSQLTDLAHDFGAIPLEVIPNVRKAVEHTLFEGKKVWKPEAKVTGSARAFASSIDYTLNLQTSGEISGEVGPNLGRAGGGWGLLDEGGSGVLSAPQHGSRTAAKAMEVDLEKGIELVVKDIL